MEEHAGGDVAGVRDVGGGSAGGEEGNLRHQAAATAAGTRRVQPLERFGGEPHQFVFIGQLVQHKVRSGPSARRSGAG